MIAKLTDKINDEICDAKKYAEKYLETKAKGETNVSSKYYEMAQDEIKHAMYLHEIAVNTIENLRSVYTPPVEMMEKWEKTHARYVDASSRVKQMLTM